MSRTLKQRLTAASRFLYRRPRRSYVLLAMFLGAFGAHNFYIGNTGRAVCQLLLTLLSGSLLAPLAWAWAIVEICTMPKAPGQPLRRVDSPTPCVALTFDDGPHATITPQVLDVLRRHGVQATFFAVGRRADSHPGILARARGEGHEIGVHTWSHIAIQDRSIRTVSREITRGIASIEAAIGERPRLFRPPCGFISPELADMIRNRFNMPVILWDVDTFDWSRPGTDKVIARALDNTRPGSIILLHDVLAETPLAVEAIVQGLQERGFRLVTVSQLMQDAETAPICGMRPPCA